MGSQPKTPDLDGVSIKTGFPNPALDSVLENPDFNRLLIKNPASTFCMQIEGGNWEDQGIFDGDIVVVDRALVARKTDLVVWIENSDFIISKLVRVTEDSEVWGVVTSIIHRFKT